MVIKNHILFVVPTYNRCRIVNRTVGVNSNICKRYAAVDLLVIDNKSTDSTVNELRKAYPDLVLVENSENIGLKGSFRRTIQEFCNQETILIFLSDEDVIFEPGLNALLDKLREEPCKYNGANVLIFNYINKIGKDFYYRRNYRICKDWDDVEIFSFGLITGFGYIMNKDKIENFPWNAVLDSRNTYPHLSFFGLNQYKTIIAGLPIAASYIESGHTFLYDEWLTKGNHFSYDAVTHYLEFHRATYSDKVAKRFRRIYRAISTSFNGGNGWIGKLATMASISYLLVSSPKLAIYYLIRKYS